MRRELVPATHGAELRGGSGVRAVELVDRRVDPPRRPFRLAGYGLRHLTRGYIAPAAPHSRASQRVWQVNGVVPPIPLSLDRGVDLGSYDQQALVELGHFALLSECPCARRVCRGGGGSRRRAGACRVQWPSEALRGSARRPCRRGDAGDATLLTVLCVAPRTLHARASSLRADEGRAGAPSVAGGSRMVKTTTARLPVMRRGYASRLRRSTIRGPKTC